MHQTGERARLGIKPILKLPNPNATSRAMPTQMPVKAPKQSNAPLTADNPERRLFFTLRVTLLSGPITPIQKTWLPPNYFGKIGGPC